MGDTDRNPDADASELEGQIAQLQMLARQHGLDVAEELRVLQEKLERMRKAHTRDYSPVERVQLARHPKRPYTLDYIELAFTDFIELHGDRLFRDDEAIVGGWARLEGRTVMVVGHQKGRDMKQNLYRNFGMPHPEGYRKALRLMQQADKFHIPVITLIDTPGAYPGIGAEERGQAEAIARNLREMAGLRVPTISIVTGEGASGGALGIGVTDRIVILENAFYSVISPEGCAAILWKDGERAPEAATALRLTSADLLRFRVVDEVVPEPVGGAHRSPDEMIATLRGRISALLDELAAVPLDELVERRYERLRALGEVEG